MIESWCRTESTMTIPMGSRQIADDLRARIQAGEYPPGEPIPTLAELAKMYSVAVSTIQKAISRLQIEGVLVGVQGKRNYVAEERKPRNPGAG